MNDIRDIKPPVDVAWIIWTVAAVLIVAIAVAIFIWLRRRRPAAPPPASPVPTRPAWEIAYEQLDALTAKQYPKLGQYKHFYAELSNIVRHYLENQFHIRAPEMTTEEFLDFAKTTAALKAEHKIILKDFLSGCDMVKFAQYSPTINEAQDNFNLARTLIDESKQ